MIGYIIGIAALLVLCLILWYVYTDKRDTERLIRKLHDIDVEVAAGGGTYTNEFEAKKAALLQQFKDFCDLCGIEIVYQDNVVSRADGHTSCCGQIVDTVRYAAGVIDPYLPSEQLVRRDGYKVKTKIYIDTKYGDNCWTFGHEIGHWIGFRRNEESTEESADRYARQLCKILLSPSDYEFLKEYIDIYYPDDKEDENHDVEGTESDKDHGVNRS